MGTNSEANTGLDHSEFPGETDHTEQSAVVRGLVHDVNNNLMAIMAGCDQLEKQISPDELTRIVSLMRSHIKAASTLVNDLTRKQIEDKPVAFNHTELRDFLVGIQPSLELVSSDIINIEIGPVVTWPVLINPVLLHRILMQFVRNSVETGHRHLVIFISVRMANDWCELSISDNGPGIKGIEPADVFNPGISTKDDHKHRGFGLSAVAYSVRSWGGTCGAENLAGCGCRFWITFPLVDNGAVPDVMAPPDADKADSTSA